MTPIQFTNKISSIIFLILALLLSLILGSFVGNLGLQQSTPTPSSENQHTLRLGPVEK